MDKLDWDSWNSNKDKSRSACIDEFVKLGEEFAKKKGVTRKQIVEDIEAGYEQCIENFKNKGLTEKQIINCGSEYEDTLNDELDCMELSKDGGGTTALWPILLSLFVIIGLLFFFLCYRQKMKETFFAYGEEPE